MRRLVITENFIGTRSQFIVETSAGVRATSSTLEGALSKLTPVVGRSVPPEHYFGIARAFKSIRPSNGRSQIHEGQEGA